MHTARIKEGGGKTTGEHCEVWKSHRTWKPYEPMLLSPSQTGGYCSLLCCQCFGAGFGASEYILSKHNSCSAPLTARKNAILARLISCSLSMASRQRSILGFPKTRMKDQWQQLDLSLDVHQYPEPPNPTIYNYPQWSLCSWFILRLLSQWIY